MQLMLTYMLSTNSLSAFSSAATIPAVQQPGPIRLVREQRDANPPAPAQTLGKHGLPGAPPTGHTPRGSLLNLSV